MSSAQRGVRSLLALVTALAVAGLVLPAPAGAAESGTRSGPLTRLVSTAATGGMPGDAASIQPSVSANGTHVAFVSAAQNLTSTPSTPGTRQIYLKNTATGAIELISRSATGEAGVADSVEPAVSDDGRFVAFLSSAANLGVQGGIPQALVWSRDTGAVRVVSVSNDPVPVQADQVVQHPVISGDGSTIAFQTGSTTLTADDTKGRTQVYTTGTAAGSPVTLVSVQGDTAGTHGADLGATAPAISADGRRIAFVSTSELSGVPTGGKLQVFVASNGLVRLVSASGDGAAADAHAEVPTISADGGSVAFLTQAQNLTDDPNAAVRQAYVADLDTGRIVLASWAGGTRSGVDQAVESASLSADGRVVLFATAALGVLAGDTAPRSTQAYSRDLVSGRTELVSATPDGSVSSGAVGDAALAAAGTAAVFVASARDVVGGTGTGEIQVYLRSLGASTGVERIGGADRFVVLAAVSAASFAPRVRVAFVASGTGFADALSGSAAAATVGAPVLLTTKGAVPAAVEAELTRLKPETIIVLGGPAAIGAAVESRLATFAPEVRRIAGADRYDVSAAVSAAIFAGPVPVAYLASGQDFPDALAASAIAGRLHAPVLLTTATSTPASVLAELRRLQPGRIVVLGGPAAIRESVIAPVAAIAPTERVSGADRFVVAAKLSSGATPDGSGAPVYIASGATFPDALSGSVAAARDGATILLTRGDALHPATIEELKRIRPSRIVVLGGSAAISAKVEAQLAPYLAE